MQVQWIELLPEDGGLLPKSPATLEVPDASTVEAVLRLLGRTSADIKALLEARAVSVYGVYASANTILHPGDRLEILDALRFNPMDSRRRRAQHKAALGEGKPARRSKKQPGFPV
ncbi:MAG TPA: RnfH family protein [Limnobacter sp.]|uniref:MoaD/ThiS family protein n=1 Tax=Limnobacter sp. TaxID=2003368 RepID=UPI002ED98151